MFAVEKLAASPRAEHTELGVTLHGDLGVVGGGAEPLQKTLAVTLILLHQSQPHPRWVQIVLGRWIFLLQYRRPFLAASSRCYYTTQHHQRRRWWPLVRQELSVLVCLVPLVHGDLRLNFSSVVTASEASHFGGAVGKAEALTSAGCQLTHALRDPQWSPCNAPLLVISFQWHWWQFSRL